MKIKKLTLGISILVLAIGLVGCKSTDVVAKYGVKSYEDMINKTKVYSNDKDNRWVIEAPDKTKFNISKDFSDDVDFVIEVDAKSFINSGLDVSKLPKSYLYNDKNKTININSNIGNEKFNYDSNITPVNTLNKIIDKHRNIFGYHHELDHYGLNLDNENKFEWAYHMDKNDKDIVFVLNPQPFIKAGVDPNKIDGWIYAKVGENYKLLKSFDLVKK